MTKEQLDVRLHAVVIPAPLIQVGPYHPLPSFEGYNDPYPGWYRGVRVQVLDGLGSDLRVLEDPAH